MAAYRLPDHLGFCEIDGRVVMLDLRRDRYFQLDPGTASAMKRRQESGEATLAEDAALRRLAERGWLVRASGAAEDDRSIPAVRRKSLLGELPQATRSFRILPGVAAALWQSRWRLKRRGLEAAVDHVRRRKPAAGTRSDLPAHLASFRAARRLVPIALNCLTDSLALSAFLAARGIRADLVFGVKLDPFAAHCWLQNEDAILNDAADSVSDFTPILAV